MIVNECELSRTKPLEGRLVADIKKLSRLRLELDEISESVLLALIEILRAKHGLPSRILD